MPQSDLLANNIPDCDIPLQVGVSLFWEAFWLVCLGVFGLGWFCLLVCVCFVLRDSPRCRDGVVFFPTS